MEHRRESSLSPRMKKRVAYDEMSSANMLVMKRTSNDRFERSGKWTSEEENYANRLIFEFEAGSLEDCEEGCTLRSYLARRLRCAPMRISKKFAGRCIGKVCCSIFVVFSLAYLSSLRLVGFQPSNRIISHEQSPRQSRKQPG